MQVAHRFFHNVPRWEPGSSVEGNIVTDMVDWTAVLTDSAIEAVVGTQSYRRGVAYARNGHVGHVKINRNVIFGRVHGTAPDPYQLIVVAGEDRARPSLSATCTCPVGIDCKHAAATMIAARERVDRGAAESPRLWRQRIDQYVGSHGAQDVDATPLALQFTVETDPARTYGAGGTMRLALRPLAMGKRGRWVRKGASWRDLHRAWAGTPHRLDHLDVVRRLHALSDNAGYFAPDASGVDLNDFGPSLWSLLAEARDLGVEFVASPGHLAVAVGETTADACLDAARDTRTGGLTISPTVRVGAMTVALDEVGTVGWPLHGIFAIVDSTLELAAFAEPPSDMFASLVGEPIAVPADEVDAFLTDYYPALGRIVAVTSADDSVELPAISAPRLRLTARFEPDHVLRLEWAYAYGAGDSERTYALGDSSSSGTRDRRSERELQTRATRIVERWWQLLDRGGMLAAEGVLHGMDAVGFTEDALPVLTVEDDIDVALEGTAPAYEEAESSPLIHVAATSDDSDATDWFDLHVTVTVGHEDVPFDALFAALARGDSHLILDSGTYFRIDDPDLDRLRRLIEESRALQERPTDELRISPYQASLWSELVELGIVGKQSRRWQSRVDGLLDIESIDPPELPSGLDATLRPYQREGYVWLSFLWDHRLGGVLADDMGLGKTVQALAMVARAKEQGTLDAPVLVVAPTSVVPNWERECARFAPDLRVATVTETTARRGAGLRDTVAGADIVVVSYALFRIEYDAYDRLAWSGLVLDEAQFVKNHQGKTYACARRLEAPFKLAITGTPLENSLMDLWSMLSIVASGLFPNPERFKELFRNPIEKNKDSDALATLRRRVRPLIRRRTKELVAADLPPKQEQVLEVPLTPQHRRIYQTHLQRERQKILGLLDEPEEHRFTILRSLTLLRQLSLDPYLVDDEYANVRSGKIDALMKQLREVTDEGHRALVFSQFTRFLGRVRDQLDEAELPYAYLDGTTRDRGAAIDEFKSGRAPVFLISLKAGGFGLNLTEADYCFVLDPWWNPAVEQQAVDRAHRIGQTRNVMIYRLVSADTIEEKVMELKARKRDLVARVMDDDGGDLAAPLSATDIRGLLS